jgi:iron complex transport system substrate-binding protein
MDNSFCDSTLFPFWILKKGWKSTEPFPYTRSMPFHPPKHIASFSHVTTEILSYLGVSDEVTTLKEYCEEEPPASDRNKPEYWFSMAEGRLKSLKAELAVTFSVGQQDLQKRLKEKGFNVLHLDPRSLREVEDSFIQIGKATGTLDQAKRLAQDFSGGLSALQSKIPPNAYRPKLYVEQWNKPPSAAGGWYSELMPHVGAHYFPMLSRELSRSVKIEEILKFDPEIIIFSVYGTGITFDPAEVLKRIGWEKINAVRKRRIFTVEETLLNRPGPRLIDGAKVIQWILGESFWGWPLVQSTFARRVVD